MADDRKVVVSRREPITVTVELEDGSTKVFEAREIPRWRGRNDLANEVVHQYTAAMNGWLHSAQDEATGQISLQGDAFDELIDWDRLFLMGFGGYDEYEPKEKKVAPPPDEVVEAFERIGHKGMVAVLSAVLEVNGLKNQIYMLDREKKDDDQSPSQVSTSDADGQRTESSPVSG